MYQDSRYILKHLFMFHFSLLSEVIYAFKPDAIVLQCGADSLSNDPLGGFNLTPCGIAKCISKVMQFSRYCKVHIFWENYKVLRNLRRQFDWHYIGQIYPGDFAKFCSLLRIYELYKLILDFNCTNWNRSKIQFFFILSIALDRGKTEY